MRWTALATALCLLSLEVSPVPAAAASPAVQDPAAPEPVSMSRLLDFPRELGRVQDVYEGSGTGVWVLVQDAHAVPDAQAKIRGMLDHFARLGIRTVGVEGASSELDPRLLRSFPRKEVLDKVLTEYHERGETTAATEAALLGSRAAFQGVEDWPLYEKGFRNYLEARTPEEILKSIASAKKRNDEAKKKSYPAALAEADRLQESFYEGKTDLLETLQRFAGLKPPAPGSSPALLLEEARTGGKAAPIEAELRACALDLRRTLARRGKETSEIFNRTFQQFLTGEKSASEFAAFLKGFAADQGIAFSLSPASDAAALRSRRIGELEGSRFLAEFEAYMAEVKEPLLAGGARELDRRSRRLRLIRKLAALELGSAEWHELVKEFASDGADPELLPLWRRLGPQRAFYANAEERNAAFIENLSRKMKQDRTESSILVAGGYHAQGLTEILKQRGISYVLIAPEMRRLPEENLYRRQMLGGVSWRSFLAPSRGKVDIPGAFLRGFRDRLLGSIPSAERGACLKLWRDTLIRSLADEGRLGEAGRYLKFLDEAGDAGAGAPPGWQKAADEMIRKLSDLEARGQLTEKNILGALRPSAFGVPWVQPALGRSETLRAGDFPDQFAGAAEVSPAAGRSEYRPGPEAEAEVAGLAPYHPIISERFPRSLRTTVIREIERSAARLRAASDPAVFSAAGLFQSLKSYDREDAFNENSFAWLKFSFAVSLALHSMLLTQGLPWLPLLVSAVFGTVPVFGSLSIALHQLEKRRNLPGPVKEFLASYYENAWGSHIDRTLGKEEARFWTAYAASSRVWPRSAAGISAAFAFLRINEDFLSVAPRLERIGRLLGLENERAVLYGGPVRGALASPDRAEDLLWSQAAGEYADYYELDGDRLRQMMKYHNYGGVEIWYGHLLASLVYARAAAMYGSGKPVYEAAYRMLGRMAKGETFALAAKSEEGTRSEIRGETGKELHRELHEKVLAAFREEIAPKFLERGYDIEVRSGYPEGIVVVLYPADNAFREKLEKIDLEAKLRKIEVPFGSVGWMKLSLIEVAGEPALYVGGLQSSYSFRKTLAAEPEALGPYLKWTYDAVELTVEAAAEAGLENVYAKTPELAQIQHHEIGGAKARRYYLLPFRRLFRKEPVRYRRLDLDWTQVEKSHVSEKTDRGRVMYFMGGQQMLWHYRKGVWLNPGDSARRKNPLPKSRFRSARKTLQPHIVKTPLFEAEGLGKRAGKRVFVKDESVQAGGSFKARGVFYEVYSAINGVLRDRERGREILKNGFKIVTQSTGNHGIAMIRSVTAIVNELASRYDGRDDELAAYIRRIEPVVYSFKDLSPVKRRDMYRALDEYRRIVNPRGGAIRAEFENYDKAREERERFILGQGAQARYMEHGGTDIMLGHGTAGIEIAEQLREAGIRDDEPVVLVIPVGAGGPIGIAAALKAWRPNTYAVMVQSDRWEAFVRTLQTGKYQKNPDQVPPTDVIETAGGELPIIFPDGIAVDGPEPAAVPMAEAYLDAAVSVDERRAYDVSGPLLLSDLQKKGGPGQAVGGTSALTAEALLQYGDKLDVFRKARAVVLFATEGNVAEPVLKHLREKTAAIRESGPRERGRQAPSARSELRRDETWEVSAEELGFLRDFSGVIHVRGGELTQKALRDIARVFPRARELTVFPAESEGGKPAEISGFMEQLREGLTEPADASGAQAGLTAAVEGAGGEAVIRVRLRDESDYRINGREFRIRPASAESVAGIPFDVVYVPEKVPGREALWAGLEAARPLYVLTAGLRTAAPESRFFTPAGRITARETAGGLGVRIYKTSRPVLSSMEVRGPKKLDDFLNHYTGPVLAPAAAFNVPALEKILRVFPGTGSVVFADNVTFGREAAGPIAFLKQSAGEGALKEELRAQILKRAGGGLGKFGRFEITKADAEAGTVEISLRYAEDAAEEWLRGREITVRIVFGDYRKLEDAFEAVYVQGGDELQKPEFWKHVYWKTRRYMIVDLEKGRPPEPFLFQHAGLIDFPAAGRADRYGFVYEPHSTVSMPPLAFLRLVVPGASPSLTEFRDFYERLSPAQKRILIYYFEYYRQWGTRPLYSDIMSLTGESRDNVATQLKRIRQKMEEDRLFIGPLVERAPKRAAGAVRRPLNAEGAKELEGVILELLLPSARPASAEEITLASDFLDRFFSRKEKKRDAFLDLWRTAQPETRSLIVFYTAYFHKYGRWPKYAESERAMGWERPSTPAFMTRFHEKMVERGLSYLIPVYLEDNPSAPARAAKGEFGEVRPDELTAMRTAIDRLSLRSEIRSAIPSGQPAAGASERTAAASTILLAALGRPVEENRLNRTARVIVRLGVAPVADELGRLEALFAVEGKRILAEELGRAAAALPGSSTEGYSIAYELPETSSPLDIGDFVKSIRSLGSIREIIVPKGRKLPPELSALREDGIRLRAEDLERRDLQFTGTQEVAGMVVPGPVRGERAKNGGGLIPITVVSGAAETDTLTSRAVLAMQTAVALLLAREVRKGKNDYLLHPAELLRKYGLFKEFEESIVSGNGKEITISGAAVRAYMEWAASERIQMSA